LRGRKKTNSDFSNVDIFSRNRIIEPPKYLIPEGKYESMTTFIAEKPIPINVMSSSHGYYVKPSKQVVCANFEHAFGFGCAGIGYTSNRVVFYPF
jgi:hypothetical protein